MSKPDEYLIQWALNAASRSPCRSKRGVVLFDPRTGAGRGEGFNGPPALQPCPGRSVCAGNCGQRSVHAEARALRKAARYLEHHGHGPWDLLHVELAADGNVVSCTGPSCITCAREILDVGFVGGVWLYELGVPHDELAEAARLGIAVEMRRHWHSYTAEEFYRVTLANCGVQL